LGKPLSSLTHEDFLHYQYFLADPQPATRWVMRDRRKFARAHSDWRPFTGPLSAASCRHAIVILNSLFTWLVNAGYLTGNPLALSRQRQRKAPPRITRYLEDDVWAEVKASINTMQQESALERERYLRALAFLATLISAVCAFRNSCTTR
jgi:integrase